jgi:hypothetical protein
MKRSAQVTLALMTVAGLGAGAYALAPSNACRQSGPNTVPGDPPLDCRSSGGHASGGHSGGHGASLFSSSNSGSDATPAASTTSTTSRGGFGWIGRALSGGG